LSILAVGGGGVGIAAIWLPRTLVYEISDGLLRIQTGFRFHPSLRTVKLGDIEKARSVDLEKGSRRAGTSIPGYCAGHFYFPGLGSVDLAGDCSSDVVVLDLSGSSRPLVVTPGRRDEFLEALRGGGVYREEFHPEFAGAKGWKFLRRGMLLLVLPVLGIPFLFFIPPRKLYYRVVPLAVEVHTTLGFKRFSLSNCFARIFTPENSMKLMGSSMPGYHAGRFLVDGMKTRVYATSLKEGILIEGPDLRLFINPEEPGLFLEVLKSHGNIEVMLK